MKRTRVLNHLPIKTRRGFDNHHLLWTRRSYDRGYARALRNHPYCQALIPKETLHKNIHHALRCVPVPAGADAKNVFELLVWLERLELLDFDDPIEKKLKFLIENLKTESTVNALQTQLRVVENFLGGD